MGTCVYQVSNASKSAKVEPPLYGFIPQISTTCRQERLHLILLFFIPNLNENGNPTTSPTELIQTHSTSTLKRKGVQSLISGL